MQSPSLIVVPPTPVHNNPHNSSPSTTAASTPDLSPSSDVEQERTSSETTIVTIYSMYGEGDEDEEDVRSWSASESLSVVGHRHKPSKEIDLVAVTRLPEYPRESFLSPTPNDKPLVEFSEDAPPFFDPTHQGRYSVIQNDKRGTLRSSILSDDDSIQLAYTDSRPASSYLRTSTITRATSDFGLQDPQCQRKSSLIPPDSDPLSHSPPHSRPPSAFGSSGSQANHRSIPTFPDHAPHHLVTPSQSRHSSRPNSQHRSSTPSARTSQSSDPHGGRSSFVSAVSSPTGSDKALPALPPSPPTPQPSCSSPNSIPLPSASNVTPTASPETHTSPLLQVPTTPPRNEHGRRTIKTSTPESKYSSITRSEGEDVDSFHVRSTYAQLNVSGVKGDGYDEGVERTRARVGGSRASELRAIEALADEHEKSRDLTPQELETLASLDRYGFFVIPSHDRLILLTAAPLAKRLSRVAATVTNAPPNPPLLHALPPCRTPPKEISRTAKWDRMLAPRSRDQGGNIEEWGVKHSKERKLSERVYKGIPDRWRNAAWELLVSRHSKSGRKEYQALVEEYHEALDKPSTYDIQIDLDVPRTITGHIMFRTRYGHGQRSLFHVLHCLSLHCDECGYCQGMGPIAATLLCYFDPEHVYATLIRLHDHYSMHAIFSPGFPGLLEAIYVQERIMEQMMPSVYAAFKKHMISTTSYATKWYITLFANSVPFQTQLRLWDAFLLEGPDIFVVVAVAIVWVYRDHITSDSANFESVLSLLSSFFVPEDENTLLAWIEKVMSDKKLRSSMHHWRAEWKRLVESGEQSQALL